MLLPSTFTTATFFAPLLQFPLGTYKTTFVPVTSTDSTLEGWHDKALKGAEVPKPKKPTKSKVAVTLRACVMFTMHMPVPLHPSPVQLVKLDPLSAVAVSVTWAGA